MKDLNVYINEALFSKVASQKAEYTCHPKDKEELRKIIRERIEKEGFECDLNDIDVSGITDMSNLFNKSSFIYSKKFNCDISQWDVSKVENMSAMFTECTKFNQDISRWDVSNVTDMSEMFFKCESFNSDISEWDTKNVKKMQFMFSFCKSFNQDLSKWHIAKRHTDIFARSGMEEKNMPKDM